VSKNEEKKEPTGGPAAKLEDLVKSALPADYADLIHEVENAGFMLLAVEFGLGKVSFKFTQHELNTKIDFGFYNPILKKTDGLYFTFSIMNSQPPDPGIIYLVIYMKW